MKLKLKEKELPPVQLRLVLPAAAKQMLDRYVAFVGQTSGFEVEAREVAVEMLELFMTSHHDFRQWHNWGRGASSSRARTGSTRGAR